MRQTCIRWGPDPTMGRGTFEGDECRPVVVYSAFRIVRLPLLANGKCACPAHVAAECIRCCED